MRNAIEVCQCGFNMNEAEAPRNGRTSPIICIVRYEVDPEKRAEFELYARLWVELITRHGGDHHGCFLSREPPPGTSLSFLGIGREAPENIAVAFFSFPNEAAYADYRAAVREDLDCAKAEELLRTSGCVLGYERSFMSRMDEEGGES